MKPCNPFVIGGHKGPEYLCDREKETAKVVSAMTNGWNTASADFVVEEKRING